MPDTPLCVARNPRAMAEVVLGRPIDWTGADDPRGLLERILITPYEELFDPRHGSPVYLGYAVTEDGRVASRAPASPATDTATSDLIRFPRRSIDEVRRLADLGRLLGADFEQAPVRRLTPAAAGGLLVELGEAPAARQQTLGRVLDARVIERLWADKPLDTGWTPPGATWRDVGEFFDEAAEFFDPVQGSLGDCWLIAAMSSVAWTTPYTFAHRSRATGTDNQQFTNYFQFYDSNDLTKHSFETNDEILTYTGTTTPLYARSSEPGEVWPALVEKAFAMWWAGTPNQDHPRITALGGGDPVAACVMLTGGSPQYTATAQTTADALMDLVKSNSVLLRTVNPMTAWTYPTGDAAPDKVDYGDANIVGCHAYSVLGWVSGDLVRMAAAQLSGVPAVRGGEWLDHIVLRNPWGFAEATVGAAAGVIPLNDVGFWRSVDLNVPDGVFAIDAATFKRYFAGIGVVVPPAG